MKNKLYFIYNKTHDDSDFIVIYFLTVEYFVQT